MGKRSTFERIEKDFYRTFDPRAVTPLLPHLGGVRSFCEPCAGAGDLVRQLERAGLACAAAYDLAPGDGWIETRDALTLQRPDLAGADCIITNPPWSRDVLHRMIVRFAVLAPTWLLFDADWIHTAQSGPFQPLLSRVVSVGRLCWIEGTGMTGKDNCAWHLFDAVTAPAPARFFGRAAA
jgi:hypothetical protein